MDNIQLYKQRQQDYNQRVNRLEKRSFHLSIIRLFIVIIGIGCIMVAFQTGLFWGLFTLIATVAIFIAVLTFHWKTEKLKTKNIGLRDINENEIYCLQNHENSYYHGLHYLQQNHPYANDLDVFGPFSIFQLINRCKSYHGNLMLSKYLGHISPMEEILARQDAVKELEPNLTWRQDFMASLLLTKDTHQKDHSVAIENYLGVDILAYTKQGLLVFARWLPFLWLLIIAGWIWINPAVFQSMAILLAMAVFTTYSYHFKGVSEVHSRISQAGIYLAEYTEALHLINQQQWESDYLTRQLGNTKEHRVADIHRLEQLNKLINKMDYRLNMLVGFLLNFLMLWDFRILDKMAAWQGENTGLIPKLFLQIGTFEAINSLATWSYNHPDDAYPEIDDLHFRFSGQGMRHPLMKKEACVPNDFSIEQRSLVNIITGSNMSGKSTFLRTLGLNLVLAYAGTKSAAMNIHCSLVQLVTYMRIKDNLEENVSTFKAELNRVEMILDKLNKQEKMLILIDEMLRGTNSRDKLKGSIAITKKIIEKSGYAVIATHDIKLAELQDTYPDRISNYYFDITFANNQLSFDYKLKKGICENFNASYLLKQIGIE